MLPADDGVSLLQEFAESNIELVSNSNDSLGGVMNTYREENRSELEEMIPAAKKGLDDAELKVKK